MTLARFKAHNRRMQGLQANTGLFCDHCLSICIPGTRHHVRSQSRPEHVLGLSHAFPPILNIFTDTSTSPNPTCPSSFKA